MGPWLHLLFGQSTRFMAKLMPVSTCCLQGQDPFLVDQLKVRVLLADAGQIKFQLMLFEAHPVKPHMQAFFHRMRPTELNHTYAFPSGHTTAATFIVGEMLSM